MSESQPNAVASDPFYEIRVVGKRVLLRVRPPEGGRRANLTDIQRALRQRDVPFRPEVLFDIYRRASNELEPLSSQESTRFDLQIEVSDDAQQAFMTVVPPDKGQEKLTPARLKAVLEGASIHKGINYDAIREILQEQKAADHVLIAQGHLKEDGVDGNVELVHPSDDHVWVDEGTVNYRELNLINNVVEGDLIARIKHPTTGRDGYDVHAHVLKARPGKRVRLKLGRNVRLSEDGQELFAAKDGYVVRRGDKFSVENILEVNNVDAETGNLRFHGVIRVHGQVDDAYLVEAEKGIEVAGTVGKATLRSKGDIRIKGGVFGATLETDGNVYAAFLSECTVKAGAQVSVTDYILHSTVVAKRAVRVTAEPKGFIQGGRIKAGTEISAATVGSDATEMATVLEVGGGVNVRKRFDALQERIDANLASFENVRKNLAYLQQQKETVGELDARKRETYESMVDASRKLIAELQHEAELHHELLEQMAEPQAEEGLVLVSEQVHPGTTVQIQTSRVSLHDPLNACGFAMLSGSLKAIPYSQALRRHKQLAQRAPRAQAAQPGQPEQPAPTGS